MENECYEWWVNEFYNVLVMKMKHNWESNRTLSFIGTKTLARAVEKESDSSTFSHSDSFEINIGKAQGNE